MELAILTTAPEWIPGAVGVFDALLKKYGTKD